nr:MAG: RNA-dependent RNA polymerase [Nodaviridae sp.]
MTSPEEAPLMEDCDHNKREILVLQWPKPMWQIATHRACVHNEIRSLQGRVLKEVPVMAQELLPVLRAQAVRMASLIPPASVFPNMEALISHFPQSKRKMYLRERESLLKAPWSRKDALIKSFVKSEKLKILDKDGDPRMIQARNPRFNLELGMFTKAIEHSLYNLRDPDLLSLGVNVPIIAKGRNLYQRAQDLHMLWNLCLNPVALSLDLSRWDMHVGTPMIGVMHLMYKSMIENPYFQMLLECQMANVAITQNRVRYKTDGGVMSGDMTTALGNCVAVIVIILSLRQVLSEVAMRNEGQMPRNWEGNSALQSLWLNIKPNLTEKVLSILRMKVPFLLYDDGDDHAVIMERELVPLMKQILPQWWALMGHELKVESEVQQFHQILFCQHKPHLGPEGWVMMPDPTKVLATSMVVSGLYKEKPSQYLKTLWTARYQLHWDQPILGPLFLRLKNQLWWRSGLTLQARARLLKGIDMLLLRTMNYEQRQMARVHKPTPEQRVMAWEQWGITPTEQIRLEGSIIGLPPPQKSLTVLWPFKIKDELCTLIV